MHINKNADPASKQLLYVLDVDGTLTHHDSLLLLVKYLKPSVWSRAVLWAKLLPVSILAVCSGKPGKLKQALLSRLWKGQSRTEIATACAAFFVEVMQPDLRRNAMDYFQSLKTENPAAALVLLSASCRPWLQPLADYLQAHLICTELEYNGQQTFTGYFATPNCKGQQKVQRLLQQYPIKNYGFICYVDSRSDLPLQTISKQFFYRYF